MCLTQIKKQFKTNDKMVIAYKIYVKSPFDNEYTEQYKRGKRVEGKHYRAKGGIKYGYKLGFHAYTNLRKAKERCWGVNHCICKVLLWNITAIGSESIYNKVNVVVGRNLRIMEEVYRGKCR